MRPKRQAFWPSDPVRLGCIAELSIEICLMLNIRLAGNEFTMALQAANAELKFILGEDLAGELLYMLH